MSSNAMLASNVLRKWLETGLCTAGLAGVAMVFETQRLRMALPASGREATRAMLFRESLP